jgi:hypothetical protein
MAVRKSGPISNFLLRVEGTFFLEELAVHWFGRPIRKNDE